MAERPTWRIDKGREARAERFRQISQFFRKARYTATTWYGPAQRPVVAEDTQKATPTSSPAQVAVVNSDTLLAAREAIALANGAKVAILNMASEYRPGGGVRSGANAQEESLFLRTDLVACLDQKQYPLEGKVGYTTGVQVFAMDSDGPLPKKMDPLIKVDVISAAALRKPKTRDQWTYSYDDDFYYTEELIEAIFSVAHAHGVRHLVLGALGCGAYCNPSGAVAEMFATALYENGWAEVFDRVYFAIMERGYGKEAGPLGKVFEVALEEARNFAK